jgi:hypothetical protein
MRLRLPLLTSAVLLAIAACGEPDPVANNVSAANPPVAANAARPVTSPVGGPPADGTNAAAEPGPPSAPPKGAATIPTALQGRWGLTPGDCTSQRGDAKGLLVIGPTELRFYESRAVPSPGAEVRGDSIRGDFRFTGEGQSWTRFERLELNGGNLVRTESNPAASYTYAKC